MGTVYRELFFRINGKQNLDVRITASIVDCLGGEAFYAIAKKSVKIADITSIDMPSVL